MYEVCVQHVYISVNHDSILLNATRTICLPVLNENTKTLFRERIKHTQSATVSHQFNIAAQLQ